MDNNSDPNNPAPAIPGLGQPAATPTDPANAPWQPLGQPDSPQPPATTLPISDQTQGNVPASNPWDAPNTITTQPPENIPPSEAPASTPPIPLPESPWPSSTQMQNFGPSAPPSPAVPAVPIDSSAITPPAPAPAANPATDNPFLQSQNMAPQTPSSTPQVPEMPGSQFVEPPAPQPPAGIPQDFQSNQPNVAAPTDPMQTPNQDTPVQASSIINAGSPQNSSQDPLNTAFAPNSNPQDTNPFSQPASQPPAPAGLPEQPQAPETPLSTENFQTPPEAIPGVASTQLNANSLPGAAESQSGNPLPEMTPQENAPTDLSHLIAGDETHQQPGEIYNPPVANDQTPAVNNTQTPPGTEPGSSPPGKHLNLTKVLLIAGIPIVLIVAALSAYLILGIGKPATPSTTNQTSLPVEQTKQQAPLTNPPQQIVAPSPITIPEPQTQGVGLSGAESSSSASTLPGAISSPAASLSPAMQAALKKASPSPSSTTTPATR